MMCPRALWRADWHSLWKQCGFCTSLHLEEWKRVLTSGVGGEREGCRDRASLSAVPFLPRQVMGACNEQATEHPAHWAQLPSRLGIHSYLSAWIPSHSGGRQECRGKARA